MSYRAMRIDRYRTPGESHVQALSCGHTHKTMHGAELCLAHLLKTDFLWKAAAITLIEARSEGFALITKRGNTHE